jgi:alpha-galactosidase
MSRKMVLIGAGSAMFTAGIIADLAKERTLGPWEIGLVDIDPKALDVGYNLSRKVIEAREADISLKKTTNRKEVLPGADIVVTTIGVGGRRSWEADVFIPRKYGIFQPVGDSVGPGGISRAMRMIPAMRDIAEDVQKLCAQAFFINYANPMAAICRAIRKSTQLDVLGLCIGVFEAEEYLAKLLNLPKEDTTSVAIGVNHLTWIVDFRYKGRDMFPVFQKRLSAGGSDSLNLDVKVDEENPFAWLLIEMNRNPFCWSLFQTYGAYPAPYDRHVIEYFMNRFQDGKYCGKTLGVDILSFEKTILGGDVIYEEMARLGSSPKPLEEKQIAKLAGEHSQFLDILLSMEKDQRKVFSMNLLNDGAVKNLPADAVLEMSTVAGATGFTPLKIPHFSNSLAAIINNRLLCVELMVDAALRGEQRLMVEAMLVDGATPDRKTAEKMSQELIRHHKKYLPQF